MLRTFVRNRVTTLRRLARMIIRLPTGAARTLRPRRGPLSRRRLGRAGR